MNSTDTLALATTNPVSRCPIRSRRHQTPHSLQRVNRLEPVLRLGILDRRIGNSRTTLTRESWARALRESVDLYGLLRAIAISTIRTITMTTEK
jgi:hypothetical protein